MDMKEIPLSSFPCPFHRDEQVSGTGVSIPAIGGGLKKGSCGPPPTETGLEKDRAAVFFCVLRYDSQRLAPMFRNHRPRPAVAGTVMGARGGKALPRSESTVERIQRCADGPRPWDRLVSPREGRPAYGSPEGGDTRTPGRKVLVRTGDFRDSPEE
jgi:hypothetical protein